MSTRKKPYQITNQLMWNRLVAIVEEQAQALVRTAFGPSTREAGDLSAGVYDAQGRMLAQAVTGTPGHVNSMARSVGHVIDKVTLDAMAPGDVYVLNDPWLGTGHLNDIVVVTPTFLKHRLVAFFACTLHVIDIGGLGMTIASRQVYEEGLFLPVLPLIKSGVMNDWLLDIIRSNVRESAQVLGDIQSEISCNQLGSRRLAAMMEEFGLSDLAELAEDILQHSHRSSLEAIHRLPFGTWHNAMTIDGLDAPIELKAALTIHKDGIDVDFSGTSGTVDRGINVPLCYTEAYASFGIKCIVMPFVPNNAGSLSTIRITAPEHCILNARHPAPVQGRGSVGQMLPDVMFGCLQDAVGGKVPAEGTSCLWNFNISGGPGRVDAPFAILASATPFTATGFHSGGTGARPKQDGLSATAFPSGVRNVPVEITESVAPVLIRRKEYRIDSGGAGAWRGGLGQVMEVESAERMPFSINMNYDRVRFPARGRDGGSAGAPGTVRLGSGASLPGKGRVTVPAGDSVVISMPGGGGFGDPKDREIERVVNDLIDGFVSTEAAKETYSIVVDESGTINRDATQRLRAARRGRADRAETPKSGEHRTMSVMQARYEAVAELLEDVRQIAGNGGVTPAELGKMGDALLRLAKRTDLFPEDEFAVVSERLASDFRLAEDVDHRFALYASASKPNRATPPHNHDTWAIIASVRGQMRNSIFQRVDNRQSGTDGKLELLREVDVQGDEIVCLAADDFHAIEVTGDCQTLHLHLYGSALDHQPNRIRFPVRTGGKYTIYESPPHISTPMISAETLREMIDDGQELAILDVREIVDFSEQGHLLHASCLPEGQIEMRAAILVPRRSARVVVVDATGGTSAGRSARKLFDLGWKNIAILKGGVEAWQASGLEVFKGIGVLSKAFGEVVEQICRTPHITADELRRRVEAKDDVVIVDCRPFEEFHDHTIPGAINCPGVEILHGVRTLAPSSDTLVVVTCAGRTRGILGAQSLINAGIPNKVVVLANGTSGWQLSGLTPERSATMTVGTPTPDTSAKALSATKRVAERFGVVFIDQTQLSLFRKDPNRTLYCFDVRDPAEYSHGHLSGFRSAPGGQLLQATDAHMGVRNARIVLADDDSARATLTASWLLQMGFGEVYVLSGVLERGDELLPFIPLPQGVDAISVDEFADELEKGDVLLIDVGTSQRYAQGHIPGAAWALRSLLHELRPLDKPIVVTSEDGILAAFAAADLRDAGYPAKYLDGGTAKWAKAGRPMTDGATNLLHPRVDVWISPNKQEDSLKSMQAYINWELDLPEQIRRDASARFKVKL
jgi:N-methylhydantoinase B